MKMKTKMTYLGKKMNTSTKSGAVYFLARMEDENENLYEWYVPVNENSKGLVAELEKAKKFTEYQVLLELSSYQGKARIDLVGMAL
ncbi:MAG: hypothetical protein Q8906_06040 [Bacillota bacterium]|nr:hypothetical protein [Bacillota bacterium]